MPALVVSVVIAISLIAPASARFSLLIPSCGYGYGFPPSTPTVVSVAPNVGPTTGGTTVTITGTGFCGTITAVNFGGTAATGVTTISDTQATAVSPAGAAGTVDVTVTTSKGTSATGAGDKFTYVGSTPNPNSGCSRLQYQLTGSDGSTWMTMDAARLSISAAPSVDSNWILTGNADLWTSSIGFNQDLGITVVGGTSPSYPTTSGQPEAWKESGGTGGTFSPNAAAVQTVISLKAGQTYVATLQWKANQPDPGTIWAAAGPVAGQFSETCLIGQLVPVASPVTVASKVITTQKSLSASDGVTWVDMDPALSISMYAPADGVMVIGGNADLWTANAGINQNIAINVGGTVNAWKESGGSAGTFSPNAAFVQTVIPVKFDNTYVIKLQWKAQQPNAGKIYFGAGPVPGGSTTFSPTRLTVQFMPTTQKAIDRSSNAQYSFPNSTGAKWVAIDGFTLLVPFTPTANCTVIISANVDLWTTDAGVNQDYGIAVIDGPLPTVPGQPEGWKESGGSNGTYSPNAAYVMITVALQANKPYTVELVWKANQPTSGVIWAGAGPIGGTYSPTRMTLQPIGC